MSLDEWLFGKYVSFRKHKPVAKKIQERTVELASVNQKLMLLARALTGKPIEIFPAIKEGGSKNHCFFLPQKMSFYSSQTVNMKFYFFRTLFLCTQSNLNINFLQSDENQHNNSIEQVKTRILKSLFEEFPSMIPVYDELLLNLNPETSKPIDHTWIYGHFMKDSLQKDEQQKFEQEKDNIQQKINPKTIIKAKAVEEIISLTIDTKQQEDYVLTHNFEKVETAEEFSGSWRDFDGEDELEDHADALDEINMKFTVRSNEITHSVYQADFMENTSVADANENTNHSNFIHYDEWNCFKNEYRPNYVKLFPHLHNETDSSYYEKTISQHHTILIQLRKLLVNLNNRFVERKYQSNGPEIDIDAVTDRFSEIKAKISPSERVYISKQKAEKDISILLLIDISLSSDSYVDGNRIIDVAKQTSILFGEILAENQVNFSIQCFYSQTRNQLSYITVKDFDEPWNSAKHKIGTIQPIGYTRIGAALRHSSTLLDKQLEKNKWIFLLSDGKPNDFDRYEGKYGVQDVKKATSELALKHINSYALAIESEAKYYLPQMFGSNHYHIVSSPNELIRSMVKFYEKLKFN
ncbi:MAG TPA: NorD protein [Fluviicola sp.]|nr:NorD protein [Fluviicola sp.]